MKNLLIRYLTAAVLMQMSATSFSQSWNMVWQEDFGVVPDSVYADFADPNKEMPGHRFATQWEAVGDGSYAIVSSVYSGTPGFENVAKGNWGHGSWWYTLKQDHTGNKNGGMLLCNTDGTLEGEIIYSQKIEFPICSTNKYKFVMYAAGSTNFTAILPSFEMVVYASDGTILGSTKTGGVPMLYSSWDTSVKPTWSKYEVEFDPGNYEWVEFKLVNRALCTPEGEEPTMSWNDACQCNKISCGAGNDFVLDDIQLFRQDSETVPDPDITNNSLVEESSVNGCLYSSSYSIPSKVLDDWHKLYKHIYFLWQESEDGYIWNDIDEPMSGIDKTKAVLEVDITKSMQYRVIITGADVSEAQAKAIAKQISKNGGPDDGCYLFSVSNTLSAALPKPDCKYRSNLRVLWNEDFGLCDTLELKSHPNAVGTFYKDDGIAEFNGGKYVITSCPSLAISQKNSWNKTPEENAVNAKDSKGKDGGAFLYGKTSLTDTVIYEKDFNGPFCNCKAYMFNVDIFKNKDWGTLPIHIEVLDGNDVIGEASGSIGGDKGGWITLSAPFQLPSDFNKSVKLRVSNIAKFPNANKDVSFGIDNLSVAICGETMPDASVFIDGKKSLTLLSGFDCNDETPHTIDFDGIAEWIDMHPNAAFIWQSSVDGGDTWDNLSATTTSIAYEGEPEILYRVVIGESLAVAKEVAANGKPADGCSIFFITNEVGFKCKESGCRAPKFSLDADDVVLTLDTVFCETPESVDIELFQTNKVNVDDFYVATMGADKKYGEAKVMTPAPTSTSNIWTLSLDKKSAKYLIYAKNDTCKSDTVYINVEVREKLEIKPVDDQMFCGTVKPAVDVELASGIAEDVLLKYGTHEGKAQVVMGKANVVFADIASKVGDVDVTVYAVDADGKCKSEEITFHMDYEDEPDFTFSAKDDKVCKSEKAELELIINPTHNSDNHVYEIAGSDGKKVDVDDLVVFPTEKTTYTLTATSEVCSLIKSQEVTVDVELPQAIDLSTVPSPSLQSSVDGNIVCAPANVEFEVSGDNLTTWDWEYRKKGESDFSKWEAGSTSTSNSIEITEETSFRVSSAIASTNVCKAAYSEIITIEAEKKPQFTLALDKERVCETGDVELTLVTTETYDVSQIKATANGDDITLTKNKYKSTINETTKFEVVVSGKVCAETKFDTTASVDHPLSFTLTPDKTKICEGEDVTFKIDGESEGIVWYKSTDDRNYSEFTPASGNKITPDETIYVYAGTPSDGACGAFKVEPVKIEVEKALSFDLVSDASGKICAGTEVNLSVKNLVGIPQSSKWEKNGIEITATTSYNDVPVSNSTYKLTLNGDVCPSVDHEVEIEVESADALSLTADKNLICEGESVTLTKDYGTNDPSAVTWWAEVDGKKSKISEITTVAPEKSTSYYLSVKGTVCAEVYSQPAIVDVEPKTDFELTSDAGNIVCEGTEVKLSLDLKSGRADNVTFKANGDVDTYDIVKKKVYSVTPTENTTYELTIQGSACAAVTKSVDVQIEKKPILNVTMDKTGICKGESVTITPTFENVSELGWSDRSERVDFFSDFENSLLPQTLDPNKTTFYRIVTMSNTDACEQVEWVGKVEVEEPFTVQFEEEESTLCPNSDIFLKAIINGSSAIIEKNKTTLDFEWSKSFDDVNYTKIDPVSYNLGACKFIVDKDQTISLKVSGKYCESKEAKVKYHVLDRPTMSVDATADTICQGEDVTLNVSFSNDSFNDCNISYYGSYLDESIQDPYWDNPNEKWNGGQSATFNPISSISYKIEAIKYINPGYGCYLQADKTIYVEEPIILDPPTDTTLCEGGKVSLTVDANKGYHYVWTIEDDTVSTNYRMTYEENEPVNVQLEASRNGCKETYNVAINVVPTPRIVSVEESGANKFEFVAEGGTGNYMFDFGNGYQSSPVLDPATYGRTYTVKVKDDLGCKSDTTIKTPVYELEVPVAFTPNGDGENDVWKVKNLDKYPSARIKLFDRYGKKLCDMTSAEMESWDGTYNGKAMPSTDYWYEIEIDEIDKTYVGHFTLIRGKD